jgi:hypothetical protein
MFKTLAHRVDRDEIMVRLGSVHADSRHRWGRMTADQMICHLADASRSVLGLKPVALHENWFTRTVVKWFALWGPLPWPKGVPTAPEMDQMRAGTRPSVFDRDVSELRSLTQRLIEEPGPSRARHTRCSGE